jgi:dCTP deaminase
MMVIDPFVAESTTCNGMSYGLSQCGYDIRIAQTITLYPVSLKTLILRALGFKRPSFVLASSIEYFNIPDWIAMLVKDKSTLARQGIFVQNTCAEPGWQGYLTVEITNDSENIICIKAGTPIAQVMFFDLNTACDKPYDGKYQKQKSGPQPALFVKS